MYIRVSEHQKAVENKTPEKSAFAAHLLETGHSFDRETGVRFLHVAEHGRRLTYLEDIEIIKAKLDKSISIVNDFLPFSPHIERLCGGKTE